MTQIAFLLLCHKNPAGVIAQARLLVEQGDRVAIHFDRRASDEDFAAIRAAFAEDDRVAFAKRLRCGWGEWSLVAASIEMAKTARAAFPEATHFYLLSGDCMPIKPRAFIERFLRENDRDFIEHNDFFESDWIKVGIKEERLTYRHLFNERKQQAAFYASLNIQRQLGLSRELPEGLRIFIGSQWWVLRRRTMERVLDFIAKRRDVTRFFSTTWIPDETFFQTLVMHLVPRDEVESRTLTYLDFSDYGMPVVFYDDHYELLRSQAHLFGRKVSANAVELRAQLEALYTEDTDDIETGDTASSLYRYMTSRGRIGRRFARRFWESGGNIGREHELFVVVCKKWHVGKRFIERATRVSGIEGMGYAFDDRDCDLPDMGNLESTPEKRGRHRRAFVKLLFALTGSDRLMICLDPANTDLIRDLDHDECPMRVLEIKCRIDDDYLMGHAERVGLIGGTSGRSMAETLTATLRREFRDESEALLDLNLSTLSQMREFGARAENARAVADFLRLPMDAAEAIIEEAGLFD